MASPKLDEDTMIAALKTPPSKEALRTLQAGAVMLIMDAYDRKATRDMMLTATSAATNLLSELGSLFLIERVRDVADAISGITPTQIEVARQGLVERINKATMDAIAIADLLKQCPNDGDAVN